MVFRAGNCDPNTWDVARLSNDNPFICMDFPSNLGIRARAQYAKLFLTRPPFLRHFE